MDGIDFQKYLSRRSLFWEGDLVKFFNFEKLSLRVKTWMELSMDRIAPKKNLSRG
jgi:hypothetical protein